MRAVILFFFLLAFSSSYTQIRLPRLIGDGMILQRNQPTRLWGWATAGEKVTLSFNKKQYSTVADNDGKWTIHLPSQKAGGPYEMTLSASNSITIKNILFGDVWICSGQSNMELTMERVRYKYADLITTARHPEIRQFEVPDQYDFQKPHEDLPSGHWVSATPQSILRFSAVAYFFALDLYRAYKIPIGLINTALGGSPAEAWISETALKKFPAYYEEAQLFKNKNLIAQIETEDRRVQRNWYSLLNSSDEGIKNNWKGPELNDIDWPQINLPGYWADGALGPVNGAVWFRKEINVPKVMVGKAADLLLGTVVDADSVFINGTFVGTTSYQYPPRRYTLPAHLLKEGTNTIVIRVINGSGKGGFVPDKPYELIAGGHSIDLKGAWKYRLGARMEPLPAQTFIRWKPLGLFNAMIAPLTNYPIKGVIWYQGESNTRAPGEYTALMRTLIGDWRTHWQQGDFPFLFVQLANFMEPKDSPSQSQWAELRQAQFQTLSVPNTGMATAIDAGEWNDIHPLNKQTVGRRLALQAKRLAYGDKSTVASGPLYQTIKKRGNKLIVSFTCVGSGLTTPDHKELKHFAIAGADKKFVWAKACISGNQVIVWNDTIANPVAVRYAWADNPKGANLYNKEHLPAAPFEATIDVKLNEAADAKAF